MRLTKRQLTARAGLTVSAGALLACVGGQESGGPLRKEPVTLSLTSDWTNDATRIRAQTLRHWATEFPKANPNVREVEVIAGIEQTR